MVFLGEAFLVIGYAKSKKAVGPREGNIRGWLVNRAKNPRLKVVIVVKMHTFTTFKVVDSLFCFFFISSLLIVFQWNSNT